MREAILCEAHLRLESWYADKSKLDWPKQRDGVELQITNKGKPCGGDDVVVSFGTFDSDSEPEDLFNALTDCMAQASWDPLVGSVTFLGDFPEEQARGIAMSFVAHPFSDREIYQWQVANTTDPDDLWVAFTTRANDLLHTKKPNEPGAVATQNCLGAYRVQRRAGGGSHVTFTSHVNSHPWLLSTGFIFNIMWGKTVDYIDALRNRAKKLGEARNGAVAEVVIPDYMKSEIPKTSNVAPSEVVPPFASCYAPGTATALTQEWAVGNGNDIPIKQELVVELPWQLLFIPCFIFVAGVAVAVRGARVALSTRGGEPILQDAARELEAAD